MTQQLNFTTREDWLHQATELMRSQLFSKLGTITREVQISVGFPLGSRVSKQNKTIGQCFSPEIACDSMPHIFITPTIDNASKVLGVLAHELIHAYIGNAEGHGKAFKRVALGIGLEGKMTATVASDALKETFKQWQDDTLGKYPHGKLEVEGLGKKKQKTRLIKASCECCGFTMRTTQKWIDLAETGLSCPICHANNMITNN